MILKGEQSQSDFDRRLKGWRNDRARRRLNDENKSDDDIELPQSARHAMDIFFRALGDPTISVLSDIEWNEETQHDKDITLVPCIDIEEKLKMLHSIPAFVFVFLRLG